jgi:hypothetical protein
VAHCTSALSLGWALTIVTQLEEFSGPALEYRFVVVHVCCDKVLFRPPGLGPMENGDMFGRRDKAEVTPKEEEGSRED